MFSSISNRFLKSIRVSTEKFAFLMAHRWTPFSLQYAFPGMAAADKENSEVSLIDQIAVWFAAPKSKV